MFSVDNGCNDLLVTETAVEMQGKARGYSDDRCLTKVVEASAAAGVGLVIVKLPPSPGRHCHFGVILAEMTACEDVPQQ